MVMPDPHMQQVFPVEKTLLKESATLMSREIVTHCRLTDSLSVSMQGCVHTLLLPFCETRADSSHLAPS